MGLSDDALYGLRLLRVEHDQKYTCCEHRRRKQEETFGFHIEFTSFPLSTDSQGLSHLSCMYIYITFALTYITFDCSYAK